MKVLKSALIALLTTTILFCSRVPVPANAATQRYAYAGLDDAVYFCTEKTDESALFIIPRTYCVEILRDDGDWYYARYAADDGIYRAVYGYCRKTGLTPINEPLENEYLNYPIKITLTASGVNSLLPPLQVELTAAFYGKCNIANTAPSYVYCGEKFGYISQTVEDYPLNELPEPVIGDDIKPADSGVNATLITVIVLTVIAAAAIIALYFSSNKKRPPTP